MLGTLQGYNLQNPDMNSSTGQTVSFLQQINNITGRERGGKGERHID